MISLLSRTEEVRQYWCAFLLCGLERGRVQAERLEDGRRYLRRGHRSLHHPGAKARVRDNQSNIRVAEAETAMLGDFLRRTRVDRAVDGLYDDVGRGRIFRRIIELEVEFATSHYLLDEELVGMGVQISGNCCRLALVLQPDQRDVVILNESARTGRAIVGILDGDHGWVVCSRRNGGGCNRRD